MDLPELKLVWGDAGVEPKEGDAPRTPPTGETGGTPTASPETTPPPVDWRDLTLEQLQDLTGLTPEQLQGQLQALGCLEGQEGPRPAVDQTGLLTPPPVEPGEEGTPTTPSGDGEGGIPGLGVPYQDFIPFFPMVKDPTTGQWRNAEPGEIPEPPVEQSPSTEQPVQPAPPPEQQPPPAMAEQQPAPAPAPPPHEDPANAGGEGLPDANANGIPGEYGDGPDLDANGTPDEIGINPDGLQPGYPNPSTSGDWGGVGVPDPSVVPQSGATGAEAMPGEYGDGSAPGGGWVPEETGIDPYALQQPAYADPSTSGDGTWDPYAGSSFEPYVPPEETPLEEAPVAEGEDPNALGSF